MQQKKLPNENTPLESVNTEMRPARPATLAAHRLHRSPTHQQQAPASLVRPPVHPPDHPLDVVGLLGSHWRRNGRRRWPVLRGALCPQRESSAVRARARARRCAAGSCATVRRGRSGPASARTRPRVASLLTHPLTQVPCAGRPRARGALPDARSRFAGRVACRDEVARHAPSVWFERRPPPLITDGQ